MIPAAPIDAAAERDLCAAAAALAPGERAAFLDAHCAGEARARVERWLRTHESSGFMALTAERAPLEAEAAGQRIGHYALVERIGEGGFGTVWEAEQLEPVRRRVALKIIKLGMDTREVVARFEQERQALALMEHPHIARVFDAGATPTGRPYFAMELVRGARLTDYCEEARLPIAERLALFIQVCQAVQHAHQKGIIHRDLKPSNILVTEQDGAPVPKVIDFGVAKATAQQRLSDLTLHTRGEQLIGTPLYMAPEQAAAGVDIDTRSDIYALGVLLYELLTGRTPFDPEALRGASLEEVRRILCEQEPVRPSRSRGTAAPGLSTGRGRPFSLDLDWIVMKALEKDRARRYETASALAEDLRRHLASEPVLARPPSQLYRLRRAVRRNRVACTAAALIAIALLTGLGLATASFLREQEQRRVAERERRSAEKQHRLATQEALAARQRRYVSDINLAHQALLAHEYGRARRLLDAHRPAEARGADLRGWEWRWLWQQLRGEARATLAAHPARVASLSFSADGQRVAVGWSDGRVEIRDPAGRTAPQVVQATGPVARVLFSPAENVLVFSASDGVVRRLDPASGAVSTLCRAPAVVHDLAFSGDGSLLAILTRGAGSDTPWPDSTPRAATVARGTMVEVSAVQESALVVETATGTVRHTLAVPAGSGGLFNNARLSADGTRLYFTCGILRAPRLRCVRLADLSLLWEAPPPPAQGGRTITGFTALALAPDGRTLATATGYDQRTIQLWDAHSGAALRTLEGHGDYIADLAFSPDGRVLASASSDETVQLWDTQAWAPVGAPLCGNGDEVEVLAFSPDGRRLATGSRDGLALLWEPGARATAGGRHGLPPTTRFAFLLPGGRHAFALKSGNLRSFIDVATEQETPLALGLSTQGYYAGPNFLGYPATPRGFALYEIVEAGARLLAEVPIAGAVADWFAYSPEARRIAWARPGAATIHVTQIDPPFAQIDLRADGETILPASFDRTGAHLLGVGPAGDARVWLVAEKRRLTAAENYFSPCGMTVFGNLRNALGTQAIRDWVDAAVRSPALPLTRTTPPPAGFWLDATVTSRAFSPDGRTTALAAEDGSVLLFDALRQEKLATLHGRAHSVFAVAFTPDGQRLLSADDAVWDVATGQELVTLSADGALHSIAQFGDDGCALLVGSWHGPGEYQVWRAPSWEEIAAIEREGGGWPRRAR